MLLLLPAISAVLVAVAVYLSSEVVTQPGRERHRALSRAANYGRARVSGNGRERLHFHERVITPAAASLANMVLRLNPRVTVESVSARLLAAGMGRSITPVTYLALKGAGALSGIVLGVMLGGALAGPTIGIVAASGAGGIGFFLPGVIVSMRARKRREQIKAQLPDALDLLAVSVEAGLGFDGAVAKMTEHMDGALAEEFSLTLGEMRIGESRHDALKKLAARAGAPEVSSFTRAIIQADQLGISLGRILRLQAVDSRLKRQATAEERAMKSPIKMLFPTVLFIFPAMFIVVLGPAMLNLLEIF